MPANLGQAWQDARTNLYLGELGPNAELDFPQFRTVVRNAHRFLQKQRGKMRVLDTHTVERVYDNPASEPLPVETVSLLDLNLLSLDSIRFQLPGDPGFSPIEATDWRQRGPSIELANVNVNGASSLTLRFTGVPSLELRQIASIDSLDVMTTIDASVLPVMFLEAEIYQLALEHSLLEYLQDDRAPGVYNELIATVDNARPETRTVRILSTDQAGPTDATVAAFIG